MATPFATTKVLQIQAATTTRPALQVTDELGGHLDHRGASPNQLRQSDMKFADIPGTRFALRARNVGNRRRDVDVSNESDAIRTIHPAQFQVHFLQVHFLNPNLVALHLAPA
jgi:hypothetical protein